MQQYHTQIKMVKNIFFTRFFIVSTKINISCFNNFLLKTKVLRTLVLAALIFLFYLGTSSDTFGQGWYNSNWSCRKTITINSTKVPSNQTNFPVLINLTDANLTAHALSSGNDILFTSSDGTTKIPYQRETYTSGTGALLAWVNVPAVSSTANTVIYIYYGNPSATDQQQSTSVWDVNYKLVYHLGDASSPAADATSNGNIGTASAGITFGATGQIGKATTYGAASRNISAGSSLGIGSTSNFTYEVWINVTGYTNNTNMTSANGSYWIDRTTATNNLVSLIPAGSKYGWQVRDDNGNNLGGPNAGSITTGTWQYVVLVRDITNNQFRLYLNGTQQTTFAFSGALPLTPPTPRLGSHVSFGSPAFLNGSLDEFRISNNARSADWITTEYNNQSSPSTFYSVSAEIVQPTITLGTISSICAGLTSFSIPYTATSGSPDQYSISGTGISAVINGPLGASPITVTLSSPASAGPLSFALTVRNSGSGAVSSNVNGSVTVNPLPVASVTNQSDVSCFAGNNGTITILATGGTGPYKYAASTDGINFNWITPVPASTNPYQIGSGLEGGLSANQPYRIKVKDNNGCISK